MKVTPTPPLRIALLTWLLDGNEPLAGDLMEECVHRPRSWFWRQLIFAVVGRAATGAVANLREPSRLEERLASVAESYRLFRSTDSLRAVRSSDG